ncbi:MAG: helix-turn-helix domain-containing protein [Lachnospiraceae bacterium]|nr:helix-turn-helix domain-containing protein [Lachnospiraceae bacterium]MCM1235497.1 helix-turn-helix domain-containing protein [Ruminococcus flavefaciens]
MYNAQLTADRIKKLLIDFNKTGRQMAADCGLGINVLSNIRRGDVKSVETFYKIADYLDCSVDYLLGRTDKPDINR